MMYAATVPASTNLDQIRYYWANVALTFDWLYDHLTADDEDDLRGSNALDYRLSSARAQCAERVVYGADRTPKRHRRSVVREHRKRATAIPADAGGRQLRRQPATRSLNGHEAKAKVDKYLVPTLTKGGAAEGVSLEGSEYAETSWTQTLDIFDVIASATGDDSYLSSVVDVVAPYAARNVFYATMPGSTGSTETHCRQHRRRLASAHRQECRWLERRTIRPLCAGPFDWPSRRA